MTETIINPPSLLTTDASMTDADISAINRMNMKKNKTYNMLTVKNRRHFGRPAASLTQLDDPVLQGQLPKGWKRSVLNVARAGEEETSRMILGWLNDNSNANHDACILFDSVHIKGDDDIRVDRETGLLDNGDTDHLLACGHNLLLIDSKYWRGGYKNKKDPIQADGNRPIHNSVYWVDYKGQVLRFGKEFKGGKVHMANAIRLWKNYINENTSSIDSNTINSSIANIDMQAPVKIEGMIHIVNDNTEVSRTNPAAVRNNKHVYYKQGWQLVAKDELLTFLNAWFDSIPVNQRFISTDMVTLIATQCCVPYDRRAGLIKTDLLKK